MKQHDRTWASIADRYQLQLREAAPELPQQRLWNRSNAIRQYALRSGIVERSTSDGSDLQLYAAPTARRRGQ